MFRIREKSNYKLITNQTMSPLLLVIGVWFALSILQNSSARRSYNILSQVLISLISLIENVQNNIVNKYCEAIYYIFFLTRDSLLLLLGSHNE